MSCVYTDESPRERRDRRNRQWTEHVRDGHLSGVQSGHGGKFQKSKFTIFVRAPQFFVAADVLHFRLIHRTVSDI